MIIKHKRKLTKHIQLEQMQAIHHAVSTFLGVSFINIVCNCDIIVNMINIMFGFHNHILFLFF